MASPENQDYVLPESLKYDIQAVLNKNKNKLESIEIEVKIRDEKKDKNLKLLEENLLSDGYILEESQTIDYRYSKKRVTYINGDYFDTSKKSLMNDKYFPNHNLKLTVSKEEMKKIDQPEDLEDSLVRKKIRKSYKKDNFSIDITDVNSEKKELEIEVIKAKDFNFLKLNQLLNYIIEILFDFNDKVIEDFTFAMGRKQSTLYNIGKDFFSKARDLEFKDLTNDGILQPFTISLKADGETRFLYFHTSGVYLINLNKDLIEKISFPIKELNNSLFVGEIIPKEDFLFLPYDCLRYNNIDIKNQNYLIRYQKSENIYDKVFGNILVNRKPTFKYENNVESLNEHVTKAFQMIKEVNYETDGIIFTPINSPYLTAGQRFSKNKNRQLNKFLDVCKYKLPEDLTIDLLVKEDGVYTNKGKFKGTDKFPVYDYSFEIKEEFLNKIVEFKPEFDEEERKLIYKPFRDRSQTKSNPNSEYVVKILWSLSHDPIELATLEGKDNKLMRKYHNQIKRDEIISNLDGFVIDIGSGNGGDLNKYLNNRKIKEALFIEPNQDFIDEFIRRRSNMNLGNKDFKIIKGGGEETKKIIDEIKSYLLPKIKNKNDNWHINMMISLSFFWKDKEMLEGLVNTITSIKNLYYENNFQGEVYFNFLTIEGNRLKKLFQNRGNAVHLNNVFLRKIDDNEVYVDIKDSKTVKSQTEYFVYLKQLLRKIDFSLLKLSVSDGSKPHDFILSKNERTYSSLFVYGQAKYIDKSFNYLPLEVIENKARKINDNLIALGDDEIERLPSEIEDKLGLDNLYRIATMKKEGSLKHSFLKLLNESYRDADIYLRKKIAKKSPYDSFEKLPIASKVISKEGLENYNQDKDKYILLLKNSNNEYEPIVRIKDKTIERIFVN